ncbi:uncharacterized protein LOC106650419 [Trichogramma pretiosum]|uniref:uncharacterized protein LOC106650419 n=1 Tax=Trichogramma pretiosum TaxID=7493 RepID=UPI0006C9CEE2|nr:uncharacterized protein LOC106650419 [Trichogramma pretiosum]
MSNQASQSSNMPNYNVNSANNSKQSSKRHAADQFTNSDSIDVTNDTKNRCFVCDKPLHRFSYSLVNAATILTKTPVAGKIGEIVGKNCIVVVSEDDSICQTCLNLFNKLDNLENDLRNLRTNLMKQLEQTYVNKKKSSNTLPSHVIKTLQLLVNDKKAKSEPAVKKRKLSENTSMVPMKPTVPDNDISLVNKTSTFIIDPNNYYSENIGNLRTVVTHNSNEHSNDFIRSVCMPPKDFSSMHQMNIGLENSNKETHLDMMNVNHSNIETRQNMIEYNNFLKGLFLTDPLVHLPF